MAILRINPHASGGGLAFDLREILAALRPFAVVACWRVASRGGIDAVGDGAGELDALARSGARIDGARPIAIAERVEQVVDGGFEGFATAAATAADVIVTAVDSTFWRIGSDQAELLARALKRLGGADALWRSGRGFSGDE